MASNPPFQVEDQTDEDFFDKLVDDDDDDYKPTPSLNLVDGNDSDEAKAFANLSITDTGPGIGSSRNEVKGDVTDGGVEVSGDEDLKGKVVGSSSNPTGSSLVSSNSFAFDGVFECDKGVAEADGTSGFTESGNAGSGASGVKEVQWSAFSADPAQNGSNGFGSFSDFFTEIGDSSVEPIGKGNDLVSESKVVSGSEVGNSAFVENANEYAHQFQEAQLYGTATEQNTDGQDVNSSEYWENLYPGWKYDANTGQWYQVDGAYDATANVQGGFDSNSSSGWAVSNEKPEVSFLQQTAQSAVEAVAEKGTTESVTSWNPVSQASGTKESLLNWNQASQENNGYPSHMVFDPQYPGWYYDMIAQEWRSLDTYNSESTVQAQDQLNQNGFVSAGISHDNDQNNYGEYGQVDTYGSEGFSSQGQDYNWNGSYTNVSQQSSNMWQPDVAKNVASADFTGNQQLQSQYGTHLSVSNHVTQQNSYDYGGMTPTYEKATQGHNEFSAISGSQGFVPGGNFAQQFNQTRQNEPVNVSNDYYRNNNQLSYSQQPVQGGFSKQSVQSGFSQQPVQGGFSQQPVQGGYPQQPVQSGFAQRPVQSGQQFSYAPAAGRSSAGRPPHALITFGFGGKLIVMKDSTSLGTSSYGSHDLKGGSLSVLNLAEVVTGGADAASSGVGVSDYFHALCRQTLPSPLAGGNAGSKELNKWIDERIAHCEYPDMDYRKGEVLRLLFSLLKIASQHYGKFRSPFGTDTSSKESDAPELAVARLFASVKKTGAQFNEYGALANCLQKLPSEGQMRATAAEVQTLLVSGRKIEALQCAQEGHLWGPALILAAQLGDQYYVDTVKQMAIRQLVAGSPLRTLCLLIAGQPAAVFSAEATANNGIPSVSGQIQLGNNSMLDDWEENLAMITANRTKDDELVLIHLGDCLWKEKSDIIAAHICYLVAEANFEPYSDSARLCLIGADHWRFPRTFASPEAIQRTEVYEYSKLLGNSQFTLLPFQPYKLIYAHMLAEVGRVSDSLKYCQAVSKSLKTGRAPEVETWRQLVLSLEERIKTHQQGGFSTNLAPGKLVGKLLNLFDSTAHRVVGGLPPPAPSTSVANVQSNEHHYQSMGARVSTSQSTQAMSSLMPSASMEPITEWTADSSKRTMHNRSVSEPDFGRTPRQGHDSSKEASSADSQSKASGGSSRFGRFGFGSQLIQKTVGLVLKPRQDKQAKLGESNKFYYDEKLKRWVEEGVEPPAEEVAPPPPPTMATFQNGTSDYNLNSALKSEGSNSNGSPEFRSPTSLGHSSGIPPIPTTSNQFSARGRMGVRARYVDTFNKGGGNPTNLFQSPAAPSIKPATASNPKFFVPAPVPSTEQSVDSTTDYIQQPPAATNENPSGPTVNDSFHSPPHPPSVTMQRYPSMDNISNRGTATNMNGPLSSHSRRTASWSGSFSDGFSPPGKSELKPLGEVLGMPPSSFMPSEQALTHSSMNGGSFGDDLHEVEL